MYKIKNTNPYRPCIKSNKEYILTHGKGIPCLVSYKGEASMIWFDNVEFIHIDNTMVYTKPCHLDLNNVIAATSAYFAPLADNRMKRYLRKKVALKMMPLVYHFLLRFRQCKKMSVSLPIQQKVLQFGDGCFWDDCGIASSIKGLYMENALNDSLIIVHASNVCHCTEWWEHSPKVHRLHPHATIFAGRCEDNLTHRVQWDNSTSAVLYCNCEILPNNPLHNWFNKGVGIDVLVISIMNDELPIIPLCDADMINYRECCRRVRVLLPQIYSEVDIMGRVRTRKSLALSFSGGGCKSALLAMQTLEHFKYMAQVRVLTGNSGGAWGLAMYYKYRKQHTTPVEVLLEHCHILSTKIAPNVISMIQSIDANIKSADSHSFSVMQQYNVDWKSVVHTIINGNHFQEINWQIFPSNVRVQIPLSLLGNCHVD